MRYYSIYDRLATEHQTLFPSHNDATAIRSTHKWLNANGNTPDDYKLVYVLSFDANGKVLDISDPPREVQ